MNTTFIEPASPLLVACLCAQWCGVCRDYAPLFKSTLSGLGSAQVTLKWVDIEDNDELLGDLDVQNFPTLLIARGAQPVFLGAVMPHAQTLLRLVQRALAGDVAPLTDPAAAIELVANVQAFDAGAL